MKTVAQVGNQNSCFVDECNGRLFEEKLVIAVRQSKVKFELFDYPFQYYSTPRHNLVEGFGCGRKVVFG